MKRAENTQLRVAIIGASGYTGAELARLLANHPHAQITVATASGERAGQPLSNLFPSLRGICDVECEEYDADSIAQKADFAFIALGHGRALEIAPQLLERNLKIVDLGADFRLRDVAQYEKWYKLPHSAPQVLADTIYGLPELHRDKIKTAKLVANPGCYPTSAILALLPFVEHDLIDASDLIVDSASGASGAGRSSFGLDFHFAELENNFKAYGVGTHRHTPEIEQGLKDGNQAAEICVTFTPHLLPVARGILSTCYAKLNREMTTESALQVLAARYQSEPFVRVLPNGELPTIKTVIGSNFCDIGAVVSPHSGRLIVIASEDNLVKGASGQAIQNMNLMCGFDESAGLQNAAVFP